MLKITRSDKAAQDHKRPRKIIENKTTYDLTKQFKNHKRPRKIIENNAQYDHTRQLKNHNVLQPTKDTTINFMCFVPSEHFQFPWNKFCSLALALVHFCSLKKIRPTWICAINGSSCAYLHGK